MADRYMGTVEGVRLGGAMITQQTTGERQDRTGQDPKERKICCYVSEERW